MGKSDGSFGGAFGKSKQAFVNAPALKEATLYVGVIESLQPDKAPYPFPSARPSASYPGKKRMEILSRKANA